MPIPYDPSCFNVASVAHAKAIILTPDESTTDERWAQETPYLGALIEEHLGVRPRHRVLDYGCGIGRLSKELIERCGCSVVGVDTSLNMRALAPTYVRDDRFLSCPPAMLSSVADFHFAVSVWVLQHVLEVEAALDEIRRHLHPEGRLFVVNTNNRYVPVAGGNWADDGKDVRDLLGARFNEIAYGRLDPAQTSRIMSHEAFWGVYQRRT